MSYNMSDNIVDYFSNNWLHSTKTAKIQPHRLHTLFHHLLFPKHFTLKTIRIENTLSHPEVIKVLEEVWPQVCVRPQQKAGISSLRVQKVYTACFTKCAMCMTFLCLETSLPMQRSHWHLMSRHFCLILVSKNSTGTAISMHHSFTKLRRTLRRDYIWEQPW